MTQEKIYLLPLGLDDNQLLETISDALEDQFGVPVEIHQPLPVPESAFSEARGQYNSTAILRLMTRILPSDMLRILAVTDVDLFVPQLNFVFGEAAVDGQVSIISLCRLRPEFYGEPANDQLFIERTVKEAVHELGHTFGLRHCGNPQCVMFFSNNIQDTDRKSSEFCAETDLQLRARLRNLKTAA